MDRARISWAVRRGMLELDLILGPFFEGCYDQLSPQLQQDFVALLSCPDQQLFDWLVKKQPVEDSAMKSIVGEIINGSQLFKS